MGLLTGNAALCVSGKIYGRMADQNPFMCDGKVWKMQARSGLSLFCTVSVG